MPDKSYFSFYLSVILLYFLVGHLTVVQTRHLDIVVVVYHVTIVAIGHGLLKKFWPMVIGCVLRNARSSII